jgi:hypothetical protein
MDTEPQADIADVAEYQAMTATKGEPRTLRAAVVILKVIAALYLVLAIYGVYAEYSAQMTTYQKDFLHYMQGNNPYATEPRKASAASFFLPLLRETLVAFFIFVSGEVIKLHLGTRSELNRVSAKLGL